MLTILKTLGDLLLLIIPKGTQGLNKKTKS